MEIRDEALLHVGLEQAWQALHDAQLLQGCVPGCERLEWVDDVTLEAELVLRAAGLRRRYASRVHIRESAPMESYTLLFGSKAETASVASRIRLEPHAEGSLIRYEVEALLDGALMRLGTGIVEKIARKMAERFFERLNTALRESDSQ